MLKLFARFYFLMVVLVVVVALFSNSVFWYGEHFRAAWFIVFIVVIAAMMLASIYPFYHDFRKLEKLAHQYGEGDFTPSIKISPYAALYRLYKNLLGMGDRIKGLLSAQQELTQAISHELKTPLARLKFAIKLRDEAEANDAINDLDNLISELLLYSNFQTTQLMTQFETIQIKVWLEHFVTEKTSPNSSIQLSFAANKAAEMITVSIAPVYFKKALENLLSNAFRYTKSQIKISLTSDDTFCFISVADDGPGIPEADRAEVFEPFVSLDASRNKELSGHGLGLALVQRIVHAHQGTINIHTSSWNGAEFVIGLPLSHQ